MPQIIVRTAPQEPPEDRAQRQERDEFLRLALERFRLAAEAETEVRRDSLEDLKFYAGDQWPAQIVADRAVAGRPCLTINLLPESVSQVINQQRQGRPQIQINPQGEGATQEIAELYQGLTRHIEVSSNAEVAYDWAFQYPVICGFSGYIRVLTEFVDDRTLDQEIRIKRILNPFNVYFDPTCQEPDCSDAEWCFVIEDLTPEQYKAEYPGSEVAGLSNFRSIGDAEREWFRGGSIRTAEYWYIKKRKRTLVALTNGAAVFEEDLPEDAQVLHKNGQPLTRDVELRQVRCSKINAREVLKQYDWAGKWIPIVPVLGEELVVDGKRKLTGIVRWAKDPQRQYNYMRSALVEAIALAPKAPYIAEEGQLEGHEEEWRDANIRNLGVLKYKGVSLGGNLLPQPQRNFAEAPIAAISVAIGQANQDFRATTRIHEPMLGISGGEQSGRAIGMRQNQGNLASFAYVDNLGRAIHHIGRILVDLIPKIYDRAGRIVRIVKPDQTKKLVTLGQPTMDQTGTPYFWDLSVGEYDVSISVGPGYESKRQEFVASVMQLVQTAPQIAQFIMDLVVRHMDWPGANEIAERLKKMLPPQLQEPDEKQQPGQPQIPPEFQQKMEALLQQHAALTQQLNQANSVIESRRMELESRERMTALQEQTKLLVAELKAQSQEGIELLRQQVTALDRRLELLHSGRSLEEEVPGAQPARAPQPTQPQET
jgi:hypothetical protein